MTTERHFALKKSSIAEPLVLNIELVSVGRGFLSVDVNVNDYFVGNLNGTWFGFISGG
jgi:hypothetical protein